MDKQLIQESITLRRRKLNELRIRLANQMPNDPFSLCHTMSTGETISEFVVNIALNIHTKRKKKVIQT